MQPLRQDGHSAWKHWVRQCATAAALSMVCSSGALEPTAVFGQSGPVRFGRNTQPVAPTATTTSGFGQTVKKLMEQARREAAAGDVDAAIKTSQRASKIAEAASLTLGASPDCSPAAADQLYRELLVLRSSTSPAPAPRVEAIPVASGPAVKDRMDEPAPPSQTPLVNAVPVVAEEPEARHKPGMERWQPQVSTNDNIPPAIVAKVIATPRQEPLPEEVFFPAEAPASVVIKHEMPVSKSSVVLKRSFDPTAPIATDLGLESTLSIVGGERPEKHHTRPHDKLPIEEPAITAIEHADPDWMRSDTFVANPLAEIPVTSEAAGIHVEQAIAKREPAFETSEAKRTIPALRVDAPPTPAEPPQEAPAFVEMTVLPSSPQWETPQLTTKASTGKAAAPARLHLVTDWSTSGAVVRKHRIARSTSLQADGWESTEAASAHVTRAGGAVNDSSASESVEAVATTAFRSSAASELVEGLPLVTSEASRVAPPPPTELDEDDVALQLPSVWKREGIATVTIAEPSDAHAPSPLWRDFSAWAQHRGWTATSAACGLAAAVLALAAFTLAIMPRGRRTAG